MQQSKLQKQKKRNGSDETKLQIHYEIYKDAKQDQTVSILWNS